MPGLRIFETDPESAPKPPRSKFADDLVGRFRSGYQINGRPATLEAWRVTTGDPDVAETVVEILGGEDAQEWAAKGEDVLEVFTTAESVDVILDGPNAIRAEMVLWGANGPIRKCNGVEQLGDDAGEDCVCPGAFADRKSYADKGKGCKPSITVYFRLAAAPDLGVFKFTSGSWSLAKDIGPAEEKLEAIDGKARARLTLEVVEYESAGQKKRFVKPVVEILGAAE